MARLPAGARPRGERTTAKAVGSGASAPPPPQGSVAEMTPTTRDLERLLAPWPAIDRQPTIIGQGLSLSYVTNAFRLCTQGLRYQFVDLINELLEHDPHSRGVVRQRLLPIAGATIEVHPAHLPDKAPEARKKLAEEISQEVEYQLKCVHGFAQQIAALTWGTIYGLAGAENMWAKADGKWVFRGLQFIHSRRLNYPRYDSPDVYVWDLGMVGPGFGYGGQTNGVYGLRCRDFVGKFTLHAPQLSGDYAWRDGEARYIASYLLIKRMVMRATSQDFERTIRPWILGKFRRAAGDDKSQVANEKDIQVLEEGIRALGNGSLNSLTISEACSVEILKAASECNVQEFLIWLDEQISKALLGQTFTTQPGAHGNKSAAEIAKEGTLDLNRYDARCLADTLERDVIRWIVALNWPGEEDLLCPRLVLNVDEETAPIDLMALATAGTKLDLPIDVKKLAERCGLELVDVGNPKWDPLEQPRTRMVAASNNAPVAPVEGMDPNEAPHQDAIVQSQLQTVQDTQLAHLPVPPQIKQPPPASPKAKAKPTAAKAAPTTKTKKKGATNARQSPDAQP